MDTLRDLAVDHLRGQGEVVIANAQGFEIGHAKADILVARGPGDVEARAQAVFLGKAVGQQVVRVRHGLVIEVHPEAERQVEPALCKDVRSVGAVCQIVPAERAVDFDEPVGEGPAEPRLKRLCLAQGDIGRQRQVRMIAHGDEIGQADAGAELVRGPKFRDQETGGALQRRIGQAQARDIGNGHPDDPELSAFEIELLFFLVMHDPARADLP